MDIHFTVTEHEAASLHVGISGSRLELTGLPCSERITFEGTLGNVTFSVSPAAQSEKAAQPEADFQVEVQPIAATVPEPQTEEAHHEAAVPEDQPVASLFDCLVALRKQISSEVKVPPYIIFHDSTLREMCRALPGDLQSLKAIQGVGQAKLEKYGMRFIEEISRYTAVHSTGAAHSMEGVA
jgi:superfamily II DNA helicase RecQ